MLRRICLFLSTLALFGACTKSAEPTADLSVETRQSNGVVYGTDSTVSADDLLSSRLNTQMRANIFASGAIIPNERFVSKPGPRGELIDQTVTERYNVCPSERLAADLSASLCSGVLVGPRQFLTVNHCFETFGCDEIAIAFDYRGPRVDSRNLYSCKSIRPLDGRDPKSDLVVITLDRDVTGRNPVSLRSKTIIAAEPVYTVGHPLGTPQKWASGSVRRWKAQENRIETTLDVFTGSSGAPVFSGATHRLLGLVTDGEDDFLEGKSCLKYKVCTETSCSGESVTPIP